MKPKRSENYRRGSNTIKPELRYSDSHGVKNKIKEKEFDKPDSLENLLSAYDILNSQHTRSLTIQESLKNTINILDHQIMAATQVKNDLHGRVILADEVGLGKTIEAGILLKEYFVTGMIKTALILTPPSLRTQWQQELKEKFTLDFVVNVDDDRFKDFDKHSMLIASLSSAALPKNAEKLNGIPWDLVIVDEAHRLKNHTTLAHRFVKELPKKFILLLSATPIQNNMRELFNMIEIINPGRLGTWNNFASKYLIDKKYREVNPDRQDELQNKLQQHVIRTTRDEVKNYLEFTDRIPKTHMIESSDIEREFYNSVTDYVRNLWKIEKGGRNFVLPLMTLQRQLSSSTEAARSALYKKIKQNPDNKEVLEKLIKSASGIKKDSKMNVLEDIIEKDREEKYLIFTSFTNTQEYISDALEAQKMDVVKFNGQMTTSERDTSISKFRRDVNILVSTEAGGEGLNFQFCNNVINYDLPWNPMRIEQRVGRVHRIGQESDVKIHNLAIVDTIDAYILKLLFDKINMFKMTIGDLDLLFEDGITKIPGQIFENYMAATTKTDRENKFTALGKKWKKEKSVKEEMSNFDEETLAQFNLSPRG